MPYAKSLLGLPTEILCELARYMRKVELVSLGFDAGPLSIGEFQTPLYSNLWSISRYVAFPSFICPLSLRLGRILLNTDSIAKAMAFRRWNRPKLSAKRQPHILARQQDSGPALATLYPLITALED